MVNIPDAPWIREIEATGYCSAENGAWWNTPPKNEPAPTCPVCGEETDEFYKGKDGEIVGCGNCISTVDAWEEVSDGDVFYGNSCKEF